MGQLNHIEVSELFHLMGELTKVAESDDLARLLSHADALRALAGMPQVDGRICHVEVTTRFPVEVDYSVSCEEYYERGDYRGRPNPEHFLKESETGCHIVTAVIIQPSEPRVLKMAQTSPGLNYRHATIREMLAFGAQYQDVPRNHTILALGTSHKGCGRLECILGRDVTGKKRCAGTSSVHSDYYFKKHDKILVIERSES